MKKEELNRLRLRMRHLQEENDRINLELLRHKKAVELLEGISAQLYLETNTEEDYLDLRELFDTCNGIHPYKVLNGDHDEELLLSVQTHSGNGITQVFRENIFKRNN